MASKEFITGEIRLLVAQYVDARRICDVETICSEFISGKSEPECEDADFYLTCAYKFARETIKSVIGKYKPTDQGTDPQLKFDGYEHLQKAYPVARGGRNLLVPTQLLSDEEIAGRAHELDSMAKGCRDHAKELRDYGRKREFTGAA